MLKYVVILFCLSSPLAAQDATAFQTPSGNIHCVIWGEPDAELRCDMIDLTPSHRTPPADCDLDWGFSFAVQPRSGQGMLACVGDTVINEEAAVLGYGSRLSAHGFACVSEKTGLRCQNARGHGFALSKARQRLF